MSAAWCLMPAEHVSVAVRSSSERIMTRRTPGTVLFSAALCILAACVTTTATRLGQGPVHPAISPDSVAIYLKAADVPGKYEEVALINSKGDAEFTNEQQMYKSMRKKAAEVGANGIILDATSEPGTGAKVAQALFGTSANRKGKAIAIYVFRRDTTTKADTSARH